MPHGSVIKCVAVYDEPFWRAEGLSGQVTSTRGPVKVAFDNTPSGGGPGVLLRFLEGDQARALGQVSADDRRRAVVGCFTRFFGPRAADPIDYVERSWAEQEWTRGGYAAFMTPGTVTSLGDGLRRPVGRMHWAGTETAERSCGYMDGAITSGERAAREVLAAVGAERTSASLRCGAAVRMTRNGATGVDIEHRLEVCVVELVDLSVQRFAGVVDEDVDGPERLDRRRDERLGRAGGGDVARVDRGRAVDRLGGGVRGVGVDVRKTTTLAPPSASISATRRPMPFAEPVTTAALSLNTRRLLDLGVGSASPGRPRAARERRVLRRRRRRITTHGPQRWPSRPCHAVIREERVRP